MQQKRIQRSDDLYEKDYKISGRKKNSKSDCRRMETNLLQKTCNDGRVEEGGILERESAAKNRDYAG